MNTFLTGLAGGVVPAIVVIGMYCLGTAGRLAKMETNISWLKEELVLCLQRLNDRTQ